MGSEFPGFEEDDKPARPAKAAAPAAPPNPFANQPVEVPGKIAPLPSGGSAPPANPFAKQPVEVPGTIGAAPVNRPAPRPAAPPPEADVQPGSGKDLWACPHCQTRNKPDRASCRSCGKSPTDAPASRGRGTLVMVGALLAVLIAALLWLLLAGGDLSLHPAGPAALDAKPRQASAKAEERDLGGNRIFHVDGTLAVSGRVLAVASFANGAGQTVALALGKEAGDDAAFAGMKGVLRESTIDIEGAERSVILHLLYGATRPELKRGDYLSLVGARGELTEATRIVGDPDLGRTVLVEAFEVR